MLLFEKDNQSGSFFKNFPSVHLQTTALDQLQDGHFVSYNKSIVTEQQACESSFIV